jgi:AraC family ethanolamine operon transcriptional activator
MMTAQLLSTYRCAEAVSEANRSAGWDIEYRQLKKGRYRSHFGMRELSSVLVAVDSFESFVEITGQPPKDLVMIAVPLGDQPAGILSRGTTLTSHCVDLIDANSECDWMVPSGTHMGQIYIPRKTIRDAYRRLFKDDLPDDLNGLHPSAYESALIGPLQSLTTRGLLDPNTLTQKQTPLSQEIVELCTRIIACRARNTPTRESIRNARRHHIYVGAREYIDGNLGRPISIPDICQHLGVSVSTLERVFRRTTGLAPRSYVQSRRMNKARRLLLTRGDELTVAAVALRCGLPHFGRFSRSYRSYFRQLPSQTA